MVYVMPLILSTPGIMLLAAIPSLMPLQCRYSWVVTACARCPLMQIYWTEKVLKMFPILWVKVSIRLTDQGSGERVSSERQWQTWHMFGVASDLTSIIVPRFSGNGSSTLWSRKLQSLNMRRRRFICIICWTESVILNLSKLILFSSYTEHFWKYASTDCFLIVVKIMV